eukprot:12375580-Alexandrium_andersonii.AAC.1
MARARSPAVGGRTPSSSARSAIHRAAAPMPFSSKLGPMMDLPRQIMPGPPRASSAMCARTRAATSGRRTPFQ